MQITEADWEKYRTKQYSLTTEASDKMLKWLESHGGYENISEEMVIEYAYALATKYGEGSASLAAQMYDEVARVSKVNVPSAEVAETASYGEITGAVKAVIEKLTTDSHVASVVGRAVKQAGADTTLKNAVRDGAEFAWIPSGDGCAYCITIAANGWKKATKGTIEGNHAQHIHPNCMCEFAIRFDGKSGVKGYDPKVYKDMYDNAEGATSQDKINSLRRIQYQENKDKINAQKRANYNEKKAKNNLDESKKSDIIKSGKTGGNTSKRRVVSDYYTGLSDEYVAKSVGAKVKDFDVMDLETGEIYRLVDHLKDKHIFAGKGSEPYREYRKAEKYANKYGGKPEDWKHVKARGTLETEDGDRLAEIHWSECDGIGKVEPFVKEWLDEN